MRPSSHAPFYDLFKLIVAIILLIIFLFLIWIRPAQSLQPAAPALTSTPLPSPMEVASQTETAAPFTATPVETVTPLANDTPTQTVTAVPSPTEAITDEPLPTPIVEIPSEPLACAAYSRSQLQVGMKAVIQRRLNFRSYPGLFNNLILTNDPGTEVEVIGGPDCTSYREGGAYLWWEIELPNGVTGWSAEASAFGAFYFMEPNE
jgi:hypothetical protein